jgi:hypothetical protein
MDMRLEGLEENALAGRLLELLGNPLENWKNENGKTIF